MLHFCYIVSLHSRTKRAQLISPDPKVQAKIE